MRLDDFCGHTKGWIYVKMIFHIGGIRRYIEIWMPMKDSWIAAPHSLCHCSVLKWRTEVVLATKLFSSSAEKSPFRSQSFLNAHRQQKWWALHPICLQNYVGAWNAEPSLKWGGTYCLSSQRNDGARWRILNGVFKRAKPFYHRFR